MRLIDADKLKEAIKLALKVSEEKHNYNLCSDVIDEFDDGFWVGRSKAYESVLEMLEGEEE